MNDRQMDMLKKSGYQLVVLVICTLVTGILVYTYYAPNEKLPILNPSDFHPELVDVSLRGSINGHKVSDFKLTNQNGQSITQADYEDKIYVVDFFFTRCPSICPVMTNNMEKLQGTFRDEADVMLLSISVTPELDSIPILKAYAEKHGVIDGKWNITTGEKKHIYNLARKSYFAAVNEGDGGLQDFIHTPNFILIDKQKQIRGVYDGTKDEEIERLMADTKVLRKQS